MSNEFTYFILGASFNLVVALVIVRSIYYPVTRNKDYIFTFLAFNTITYFVLGFLTRVDLSVGVGFGLFAIFQLLRYRTDEIPIREMTYLFIIIALPVINSVLMLGSDDFLKVLAANVIIVLLLYVLEKEWGFHFETSKKITYEKIDLITPANQDYLLADLRERTGLPVKRAEVGRLDFLRDTAEIKIYYDEPRLVTSVIQSQVGTRNLQTRQQLTPKI